MKVLPQHQHPALRLPEARRSQLLEAHFPRLQLREVELEMRSQLLEAHFPRLQLREVEPEMLLEVPPALN
jgi:hypothetical protein